MLQIAIDDTAVRQAFEKMPDKLDVALQSALIQVGLLFSNEVTGPLGLSKYPRHKQGTKTPSPAGEPPAQVTTRLKKSVTVTQPRKGFDGIYTLQVGAGAYYSVIQEFGIGTPARPFMRPATDRIVNTGRARSVYVAALRKAISG